MEGERKSRSEIKGASFPFANHLLAVSFKRCSRLPLQTCKRQVAPRGRENREKELRQQRSPPLQEGGRERGGGEGRRRTEAPPPTPGARSASRSRWPLEELDVLGGMLKRAWLALRCRGGEITPSSSKEEKKKERESRGREGSTRFRPLPNTFLRLFFTSLSLFPRSALPRTRLSRLFASFRTKP